MENLKELVYKGIFDIPTEEDSCVIILTDAAETRSLSILSNRKMALELKSHLDQTLDSKMQALNVLARFVKNRGGVDFSNIRFDVDPEVGITAYLWDRFSNIKIPVAPDHAVLLSMVMGTGLWIDEEIFQGLTIPYKPNVHTVSLPILSLPDSMLKQALDQVIKEENYEVASYIRDEMKRREQSRHHSDDNPSDNEIDNERG